MILQVTTTLRQSGQFYHNLKIECIVMSIAMSTAML